MKLLILTQAVDENNPILGFFLDWMKEFAKHCELVTVVCLYKGQYDLPTNVKVLSLGKENGVSRAKYIYRFYKYIWQERNNYDVVFVHMNPIYVVLGGLLWRAWPKKIGLWYVHKEVDLKLHLAEKFVDYIFTASKESNGLLSKKVKVLSHGINFDKFTLIAADEHDTYNILYVGRISRIKNQLLLIKALEKIKEKDEINGIKVKLIGESISKDDVNFEKEIKNFINDSGLENYVELSGSVPNSQISNLYHQADLSINLCPTGGLDKVVLESIACGVPVIVYNKTFVNEFENYKQELILENDDPKELAEKIINLKRIETEKKEKMMQELISSVREKHNLDSLISKILKAYGNSAS